MNPTCLLLVEDNSDFRTILADSLTDAGFTVTEAETGDQAVELIEQHDQIDLLLTDIQMPGLSDGNDVANCAKACYFGLPVVYISGSPECLTNLIGPRDAFTLKLFRLSEVVAVVKRLLAVAEQHS